MPVEYYLNLNFVCNERCTFCASDLTNRFPLEGRDPFLSLVEVERWIADSPPGPEDRVQLGGGEPTIGKEFHAIVQSLARDCQDVVLFSNGLAFARRDFCLETVRSGVRQFRIALFGATAQKHESITRARGSFEKTLLGLNHLAALRDEWDIQITVRLLFSRETAGENPAIVRTVIERAPGVTGFSLNRLLMSTLARASGAPLSWDEAQSPLNEASRLALEAEYELTFGDVPLCVFEGENARFVRKRILQQAARMARDPERERWTHRYFDPILAAGESYEPGIRGSSTVPEPCLTCHYQRFCGSVEPWYVERFGTGALRPILL
jgi:uncharacterized Fe-S cluster-containing radical SAM superfamily protein